MKTSKNVEGLFYFILNSTLIHYKSLKTIELSATLSESYGSVIASSSVARSLELSEK